jgi:hypothetical protein
VQVQVLASLAVENASVSIEARRTVPLTLVRAKKHIASRILHESGVNVERFPLAVFDRCS